MEVALSGDEVGTQVWEEFKNVFHQKRSTFTGDPDAHDQETHISDDYKGILDKYYPHPDKSIR